MTETRYFLWYLLVMLTATMLSACQGNAALFALNAITPNSGYTLSSDLVYGDDSRQVMDIYRPEVSTGKSKVVVFVYGGAWRSGIKDDYAFIAHSLARHGHWVVIPDYRLYPDVRFPAFVEDVATAIKTLEKKFFNTSMQSLDTFFEEPFPVTLIGHSSGAHTSALIAAHSLWLEGSSMQVGQLIGLSGPYDLPMDNPEVQSVFASAANSDLAIPLAHVTTAHPPTLLIHGTNDRRVLPLHTERYYKALSDKDVDVQLHWLEGSGHAASLTGLSRVLPDNGVLEAVLAFLNE